MVQREAKDSIDHLGNHVCQEGTAAFQARVFVYLDQPELVLEVYHEIESEQLEAVLPVVEVDLLLH